MNRKQLDAIVDALIAKVQAANTELSKEEAQTLVGIGLRKNSDALAAAVTVAQVVGVPAAAPVAAV